MSYKYSENDYECTVLDLLTNEGWIYECGYDIHRLKQEPIIIEDLREYVIRKYSEYLSDNEMDYVLSYIKGVSNQSLYRTLRDTYKQLKKGYSLKRDDGTTLFIDFFDFECVDTNIFKAVNQFEFVEYKNRRPDIVLFINGIPVSVFELKNPADPNISIYDAYKQTTVRYAQDIPSLMKFDFINVISDGANTKYGSLFSGYEYYFKWNSSNGKDYNGNADGLVSIKTLITGMFDHRTLLNILESYIYIPDNSTDNLLILPKYYQYYGAEAMYKSILEAHEGNSSKGGTYWGATGCGKSYIMLFLSKKLTTSLALHKPTIIILTDRLDLDEQLSEDFEAAKEYLIDEKTLRITKRSKLHEYLDNITSGGIYLMTIQKFSEDIDLISARSNIICISDEAHRTQTNTDEKYNFKGNNVKKSYGFAKYVRDSFPNAIYVGFTGTPVDATISVFGRVKSQYTMNQSEKDGSTVGIALLPGPREVRLDERLAQACDEFYKLLESGGANKEQIEKSKSEMARIKTIISVPSRLDIVVKHFIGHYEKRCEEQSTVNGKAMFVCYDREVAFEVYKRIKDLRPEWFIKRKCAPECEGEELKRESLEIEKVKLICTNGKDDKADMCKAIGDDDDRSKFAKAFKDEQSNFKIAIVVDMWVTGFNVPSLDTMYIDKPIESHNLIQTISRVNRVFKGKDKGLIVDYIGLENSIMRALKQYSGDTPTETPVTTIETSLAIFKDFMSLLKDLMIGFDYSNFFNPSISNIERYDLINEGVEFVLKVNKRRDDFMGFTARAKKALDVCLGHESITKQEIQEIHYFLCVRSVIFKMAQGTTPDSTLMNKKIQELVNKAISTISAEKDFDFEKEKDNIQVLFSDELLEKLKKVKLPNTRFQLLLKLLKKAIKEFGKTNRVKSIEFSKRLQTVVDKYNARNEISLIDDIVDDILDGLSGDLENILSQLKEEQNSFDKLGITYDEKAIYDILVDVAEKRGFKDEITEQQYINLSKEIMKLITNKSKYTDWTNREDMRDELYSDVVVQLKKNGYPPESYTVAYEEIMKQVENYKKNND